jgi:hypothetical protein
VVSTALLSLTSVHDSGKFKIDDVNDTKKTFAGVPATLLSFDPAVSMTTVSTSMALPILYQNYLILNLSELELIRIPNLSDTELI